MLPRVSSKIVRTFLSAAIVASSARSDVVSASLLSIVLIVSGWPTGTQIHNAESEEKKYAAQSEQE